MIRILTLHAVAELFRYKSFFFLIFFLIIGDRILHHFVHVDLSSLEIPEIREMSLAASTYVFEAFPGDLAGILLNWRTPLVLACLFLAKQLISLWPSSDMRLMHKKARRGLGFISSLLSLRMNQVGFDALAVSSVCGAAAVLLAAVYGLVKLLWHAYPSALWLIVLLSAAAVVLPLVLAGFSYSSKVAVTSRGSNAQKMKLLFLPFVKGRLLLYTWLFFALRFALETTFVAAIPAYVLLTVSNYWLRILLAGLCATPAYAFIKMASFKFYLEVYREFSLINTEYASYYQYFRDRAYQGDNKSSHHSG